MNDLRKQGSFLKNIVFLVLLVESEKNILSFQIPLHSLVPASHIIFITLVDVARVNHCGREISDGAGVAVSPDGDVRDATVEANSDAHRWIQADFAT